MLSDTFDFHLGCIFDVQYREQKLVDIPIIDVYAS